MEILIAVALYLGFAMLVGRFLSFSHKGEIVYPLPSGADGSLPDTAEAVMMPSVDQPAREEEVEKKTVAEHSRETVQN